MESYAGPGPGTTAGGSILVPELEAPWAAPDGFPWTLITQAWLVNSSATGDWLLSPPQKSGIGLKVPTFLLSTVGSPTPSLGGFPKVTSWTKTQLWCKGLVISNSAPTSPPWLLELSVTEDKRPKTITDAVTAFNMQKVPRVLGAVGPQPWGETKCMRTRLGHLDGRAYP